MRSLRTNISKPQVRFQSDSDSEKDSDSEDDDTFEHKIKNQKKRAYHNRKRKKIGRFKSRHQTAINENDPVIIIDSGTDFNIVGGNHWKIVSNLSNKFDIGGAFKKMGSCQLDLVDAVTMFKHPERETY